MRRTIGVILIVALTVLATLAETMRDNLWISYRDYSSPFLTDLPVGPSRPPVAQRMVFVLVRGLRLDESLQMPTLRDLRQRGSDLVVQHDAPTYRLSAWETLFTGARAEIHGATTNFGSRAGAPISLFGALQKVGQSSAIVGSQTLGDAFSSEVQRFSLVDDSNVAKRDDEAIRQALDILHDTANPVRLLCVELTAIEQTTLNNPANLHAAISVTDTRIKTLLDSLNLGTDVLVIASDRGLSARGTDGGAEPEVAQTPLVMAGPGIAAGSQALIRATDVAPTLAALLGAPIPVQAQGQVALTALNLPDTSASNAIAHSAVVTSTLVSTSTLAGGGLAPLPATLLASALQLTTFYENWSAVVQQPRFAAELLRQQQQAIQSGSINAYQKLVIDINARADAATQAKLNAQRTQRLPVVISMGIMLLVISGMVLASRRWQVFIGAAFYLVLWYVAYFLLSGDQFSLSMFANSDPTRFFIEWQRYSALFMLICSIIVALTTGHEDDNLEAVTTVLTTILLIVAIQVVLVAWFYLQWGTHFTWTLPDSSMLVMALTALTQISSLSLQIVPELPNLPIPLIVGFITLAIYSLVHGRSRSESYGRLR